MAVSGESQPLPLPVAAGEQRRQDRWLSFSSLSSSSPSSPSSSSPSLSSTKKGLFSLGDLPAEILHSICEALAAVSIKSVRSLRLVSKQFHDIASCYGLPELTFYLHESDFNAVRQIARHPILSKHVRSLVYVPDMLDKPGSMKDWLREWKLQRQDNIRVARTKAARSRCRNSEPPDPLQLHSHHQRSKRLYEMQQNMVEAEDDLEFLQEILPLFPNVQDLGIVSSHWQEDFKRRKRTPFDDGIMDFTWKPDPPEGYRAINAFMEALPHTTRIDTFRAGSINWRFWVADNANLAKAMNLATNLTYIALQVETGYDELTRIAGTEVLECRDVISQGTLRRFLQAAVGLEHLYIDFEDTHEELGYGAHFHDFVGPNQHWPRLRFFETGGFECERQDLEAFFRRHAETLAVVHMRSISLRGTSWVPLLTEMRERLDLKESTVCGELVGEDEVMGGEEYWDVLEPGFGRHQLTEAIAAWLTCGCSKTDGSDSTQHIHPLLEFPNQAHIHNH